MEKLNKKFVHGQILTQAEIQAMADKIDELVAASGNSTFELLESDDYEALTVETMKAGVLYCELEEAEGTSPAAYQNGMVSVSTAAYQNGLVSVAGATYNNGYVTI